MNQSLMRAHAVEIIKAAEQPFEAPKPQQPSQNERLTKIEQITAKNLKTGLYIFLLLALIGGALDQISI